jgi:hypothetical protein
MAIGITVFAGDISSPALTDPPPPGDISSPAAPSPLPGDISTPGTTLTTDPLTEFTLALCAQLLSIF